MYGLWHDGEKVVSARGTLGKSSGESRHTLRHGRAGQGRSLPHSAAQGGRAGHGRARGCCRPDARERSDRTCGLPGTQRRPRKRCVTANWFGWGLFGMFRDRDATVVFKLHALACSEHTGALAQPGGQCRTPSQSAILTIAAASLSLPWPPGGRLVVGWCRGSCSLSTVHCPLSTVHCPPPRRIQGHPPPLAVLGAAPWPSQIALPPFETLTLWCNHPAPFPRMHRDCFAFAFCILQCRRVVVACGILKA